MHIVLHQPEIPENTGNIGRTCVALQATLWLVRPLGFQLDHNRLKRAGLDYWEHLDWRDVADWDQLLAELPEKSRRRVWLFTKNADREYTSVDYEPDDALVFGCETKGLPGSILAAFPAQQLCLPMDGPVRSLNLSNAVAVAGYHMRHCLHNRG